MISTVRRCQGLCVSLLLVLLVMTSATVSVVAVPPNTIIFGAKAYDISLLNDASMVNEVLAAFVANNNSFAF